MDDALQRTRGHLKILGTLFIVFGVLGVLSLFGIPVLYLLLGMLEDMHHTGDIPLEVFETFQIVVQVSVVGIVALTIVHVFFNVLIGICVMKHRYYHPCMIAMWLTCLAFPIGTAIGVIGILVMSRPACKTLFGVNTDGLTS